MTTADAVICGAGIAGVAAAHALVRDSGLRRVILLDEGAPLSLTSDKSTECYRNWWPDRDGAMLELSTRSITLLEQLARDTNNAIRMDRRGYLFVSADAQSAARFATDAQRNEALGGGPLRTHEHGSSRYRSHIGRDFDDAEHGADLLLDAAHIRACFPWLSEHTQVALHVRRAGALSAQQLGMVMLEQARAGGVQLMRGTLIDVELDGGGAVCAVVVRDGEHRQRIRTACLIDAAGPYLANVARLAGVELPVACERHAKLTFDDTRGVVPRDTPLSIWCDPTVLPWSDEEREALQDDADGATFLAPFPAGVHGRPVGAGHSLMLYWTYDCPVEAPQFPVRWHEHYPQVLIRGMSVMIPQLSAYWDHLPKAFVDGGYYTKTADNRPLIGATPVPGLWLCGALSGFGIMMAMAAGELIAAHIAGGEVPHHARHFELARFTDPAYEAALRAGNAVGQI